MLYHITCCSRMGFTDMCAFCFSALRSAFTGLLKLSTLLHKKLFISLNFILGNRESSHEEPMLPVGRVSSAVSFPVSLFSNSQISAANIFYKAQRGRHVQLTNHFYHRPATYRKITVVVYMQQVTLQQYIVVLAQEAGLQEPLIQIVLIICRLVTLVSTESFMVSFCSLILCQQAVCW